MADKVYLNLANPSIPLEDDEGGLPVEYRDFCVMRAMKWDYYTFEKQPQFIIDQVYCFLDAEQRASARIGRRK